MVVAPGFGGSVYEDSSGALGLKVQGLGCLGLLNGSWDLVTRVIIEVTILLTPIGVLITSLTKSHDPPSK